MRGQVIVERETGVQWIYIPDEHIQFRVCEGGIYGLIIAPFRTDGLYHMENGQIPTEEWLRRTCQFTSALDVPDEIVRFAVQSERKRQASVADMTYEMEMAADSESSFPEDPLKHELEEGDGGDENLLEYHYATKIQELLVTARGLQ